MELYETLFLKNWIETDLVPLLTNVLTTMPPVILVPVFKLIELDYDLFGKLMPVEVLVAGIEVPVTLIDIGAR